MSPWRSYLGISLSSASFLNSVCVSTDYTKPIIMNTTGMIQLRVVFLSFSSLPEDDTLVSKHVGV
jgi:hypothetical protein